MNPSDEIVLPSAFPEANLETANLEKKTHLPSLRMSFTLAVTVTVFWLALRVVATWHQPSPAPAVHDEFSYLLGADTFTHGRLTNPAPALGYFFESPHILVSPTYASKYPPGQAMILALGQKLFGSPYWGIVIEGAAMVFTFALMLCGWVSLRCAALISFALTIYLQPSMYWVNTYWGGCLAAIGAALVFWGIGRHWHQRWKLSGVVIGLGIVLLFWTRPYEGGITVAAALACYVVLFRRSRPGGLLRVAACAIPILLAALIWTGVYDKAVTGKATLLPYLLHERIYGVAPVFMFLPLRAAEPYYSNHEIAALHGHHGWEPDQWRLVHSGPKALLMHASTVIGNLVYGIGPMAPFALLALMQWWRPRVRLLCFTLGTLTLALMVEVFANPHYAAPGAAPLILLVAYGAESLAGFSLRGRRIGWVSVLVLLLLLSAPAVIVHAKRVAHGSDELISDLGRPRAKFVESLSRQPGKQLVFVQYLRRWEPSDEWVYNGADLNGEPIMFAHDRGTAEDQELIRQYPDRTPWLLQVLKDRKYQLAPFPKK